MKRRLQKIGYLICVLTLLALLPGNYFSEMVIPSQAEAVQYKKTTKHTLNVGQKLTYTFKGYSGKAVWKVSDSSIVKVTQNGEMTARKAGKVTVTAKIDKDTYRYIITVEKPKISANELTLEVGKKKTLKISGTTAKPKWMIKDSKIASVSSTGVITAKKTGYTTAYTYINQDVFQCWIKVVEPSLTDAVKTGDTKNLSDTNQLIVEKASAVIQSEIKEGMTDIEKIKAIHDYIVLNTKYDEVNYNNNSIPDSSYGIEGVLLNGTAVCQGYAETFGLFMDILGIPCKLVSGTAGGIGHAWNVVKLDGEWYQVDTTWDDPVPDREGYVHYSYFMTTDQRMSKDHSWNKADYPACSSEKYLYYAIKKYMADTNTEFEEKFTEQLERGDEFIIVASPENINPKEIVGKYFKSWRYGTKEIGDYVVFTLYVNESILR